MKLSRKIVSALLFSVLLSIPALCQFETRSTSLAAVAPKSVTVGDFNHDGKPDLAVAAQGVGSVSLTILLGNGDGTFKLGGSYGLGEGDLYSVATADFNHDGNLDLVVAQYLENIVSVLFGNGDGTFQASVDYPTTMAPTFVDAGDFNGDGFPDLILLESYPTGDYFSVFLSNGDGTFGTRQDTTTLTPFVLGLGDFNRDGKLDVAIGGGNGLQIYLGNGDAPSLRGQITAVFLRLGRCRYLRPTSGESEFWTL